MPQRKSYDLPKATADAVKYEPWRIYRSAIALAFVIVGIWYLNWRIPTLAPDAPYSQASCMELNSSGLYLPCCTCS